MLDVKLTSIASTLSSSLLSIKVSFSSGDGASMAISWQQVSASTTVHSDETDHAAFVQG